MARLVLRQLGAPEVRLDNAPISGLASNKVRALLCYLAIENRRPHRRETLAGLLWPDYPERSARTNLSSALSSLHSPRRLRRVPSLLARLRKAILPQTGLDFFPIQG